MKHYCKHCGGLLKPGLHWGMFMAIYCKLCKRVAWMNQWTKHEGNYKW